MNYFVGMDIGGTRLRMGAVDESGKTLIGSCSVTDSSFLGLSDDPAGALAELIREYLTAQGLHRDELAGVGIGIPGSVYKDFSTICEVPNIPGNRFSSLPLGKLLSEELGRPVFIDKDVNLLLRRDISDMNGEGVVLGVYIGTGIGMAVSIDGHILYGADGFAMDAGHMPMYHVEKECGCGKRGCAETVGSGRILRELQMSDFPDTPIGELLRNHAEDPRIRAFLEDCAYVPAILATVFNPDVCILGGGVVEMDGFPRKEFERNILSLAGRAVTRAGVRFHYPKKDDARGVIGAGLFVVEQLKGAGPGR